MWERCVALVGLSWLAAACGDDQLAAGNGACGEVAACGGEVVGAWRYAETCYGPKGPVDLYSGICGTPVVLATTTAYTGGITFGTAGTYVESLTYAWKDTIRFADSSSGISDCTSIAERAGTAFPPSLALPEQIQCTRVDAGCSCVFDWPVQSADNSGTYSTMGTTLMMSTDLDGREYCVQGDTLHFVYAHPSDPQQDYDTVLTR